MDATFVEEFKVLQDGIDKLALSLRDDTAPKFDRDDYELLRTTCYNVCTPSVTNNVPQQLYVAVRQIYEDYVDQVVLPFLSPKEDSTEFFRKDATDFFQELIKRWRSYKTLVRRLSRIFSYLEQHYIIKNSLPTLDDIGMHYLQQIYERTWVRARNAILCLIQQERECGQRESGDLFNHVQDLFLDIGTSSMKFYASYEEHILSATKSYYAEKAYTWSQESLPDYLLKVENCLLREKDMECRYLRYSKENTLIKVVQEELLCDKICLKLLKDEHSGYHALRKSDKTDDLTRMYNLFYNIPRGLDPVVSLFRQHVVSDGLALISQAEDASNKKEVFIEGLIALRKNILRHVKTCYSDLNLFDRATRDAFLKICRKDVAGFSFAELLSDFCHDILISKHLSDDSIDKSLDQVVELIPYLGENLDDFGSYYRSRLAKRLLHRRSTNDHNERSMLSKLAQICGGDFTTNMRTMVTDCQLAEEKWSEFEEFQKSKAYAHSGIDLKVRVLTRQAWPSFKGVYFNLPDEMVNCLEVFTKFYQTKYKKKKLAWHHLLSNCTVVGKFKKKDVELNVTTCQAALLMLFNFSDELTYTEIKEKLNLSPDDAISEDYVLCLLHSLSCAKYKVLVKEPNTESISQTDSFKFNAGFTCKMRRIKIPFVCENKVKENIVDRRFAIDASIVRIMKSCKVLPHEQLVSECLDQLKLKLKRKQYQEYIKYIKKRIEDLISREYLERDKDDRKTIKYLPEILFDERYKDLLGPKIYYEMLNAVQQDTVV